MEDDIYHYDFTTASDLEIFIAKLEEIIQEWELHKKPSENSLKKDDFKTKQWSSSSQCITFSDAEFMVVRYYLECDKLEPTGEEDNGLEHVETISQAIEDMMNMENDFFPISNTLSKESHPLARWYGLRDFLVVIPQYSSSVASESKIKILLSAISIASSNIKCKVPIFIQALEPWQCYFLGVFQYGNFKTDFNMVHLKRTPHHCKFLTGLLNLFKSKIGLGMLLNPVTVSVQFSYVLKDWANNAWSQESPELEVLGDEVIDVFELDNLPFGSNYDSINALTLYVTWPLLSENSMVDGENYSDLDPLQAPIWKVSVSTIENLSCFLSDYYTEFLLLANDRHSVKDLLGNIINVNSSSGVGDNEISSSLNVLTESKISAFSKAVIGGEKSSKKESSGRHSAAGEKPLSSDQLMMLLYYLFPDADDSSKFPYSELLGGKSLSPDTEEKNCKNLKKSLSGTKSAPFDGLLWRLSIAMAHVIHEMGGVRAAAYFWYEFTQELRFRWENGILIQGLEVCVPDSKTCLLNQKLQLLNCCISRRIKREKEAAEAFKSPDGNSESEGDDEFYDCDADLEEDNEARGRKTRVATPEKPMGRRAKHGVLKLLETGEPLYIPETQDSVPKTEDQLEEDTQVLLKLGTDALGSELRARLLSAYLLSDMEAFKAANPGCVLADFIRWCSPRDWIEDEDGQLDEFGQKKGHLSSRMEIPGNTWQEVWQVARPLPAKWQKRLFNDTREAEKVLDYLERKTPREFIELLLPVFSVCVVQKLLDETSDDHLPLVSESLSKLAKKVERLGRMSKIEGAPYKELTNEITAVESLLVHLKCLTRKFTSPTEEPTPEVREFIKSLLIKGETEVPGGPKSDIGTKIRGHFLEAAKLDPLLWDSGNQLMNEKWNVMSPFLSPNEKEMILRLSTAKGPQRLHAVLKKNECRICGAFTKNILYPNY